MICPACKKPLIVVEYHRIELDYCPHCQGVWFDSGELELLFKSQAQQESPRSLEEQLKSGEGKHGERAPRCPICRRTMKRATMGQQPPVIIDVCPTGDGLWFDGGEVDRLLKTPRIKETVTQQLPAFLAEVFGKGIKSSD